MIPNNPLVCLLVHRSRVKHTDLATPSFAVRLEVMALSRLGISVVVRCLRDGSYKQTHTTFFWKILLYLIALGSIKFVLCFTTDSFNQFQNLIVTKR